MGPEVPWHRAKAGQTMSHMLRDGLHPLVCALAALFEQRGRLGVRYRLFGCFSVVSDFPRGKRENVSNQYSRQDLFDES